jgi:hypothetical protein
MSYNDFEFLASANVANLKVGSQVIMDTHSLEDFDYTKGVRAPVWIARRVEIVQFQYFDGIKRCSVRILAGPERERVVSGLSLNSFYKRKVRGADQDHQRAGRRAALDDRIIA